LHETTGGGIHRISGAEGGHTTAEYTRSVLRATVLF
jgi:hypothetical protein